jgi:gamma-glutamyltranspeptidase/glutathione hydrolase
MSGVIAAGHPQTADAGARILRQGGNAVDAAVAAAFASFVAESTLVSIGGGGIAQVYDPARGQATVYDFFSTMPGLSATGNGSRRDLDFRQVMIDFGATQQPFYIGRGSVAVPGNVAGLCAMVEEWGTLPLAQILAPAIHLARDGVILSEIHAYITELLTPILTDTPALAAIYAPDGPTISAGQVLHFPQLADTLQALGEAGPALFYTGAIADQIVADQARYGGLITAADLAAYQVRRSQPIIVDYRDHTVLLPPPASAGGALVAFSLKLLATRPLPELKHNGVEHLRTLAEAMRLTNMARIDWQAALDDRQECWSSVGARSLEPLLSEENVRRYRRELATALTFGALIPDQAAPTGPANTTHISVADSSGMLVSITTSAGESAGFVLGETGVTLNNMLGEIDLHPNGFHRLPPGQRLQTMMTPTLVLRHGRPVMALGSGGSNRIRTAILQTLSNMVDFNLNLAEAVGASRVHFEDNEFQLEGGISPQVADQLAGAGYRVNRWSVRNMFYGGAHAVARQIEPDTPWMAVGDPRRGGSVARQFD